MVSRGDARPAGSGSLWAEILEKRARSAIERESAINRRGRRMFVDE
jgi:hypothetical protein